MIKAHRSNLRRFFNGWSSPTDKLVGDKSRLIQSTKQNQQLIIGLSAGAETKKMYASVFYVYMCNMCVYIYIIYVE